MNIIHTPFKLTLFSNHGDTATECATVNTSAEVAGATESTADVSEKRDDASINEGVDENNKNNRNDLSSPHVAEIKPDDKHDDLKIRSKAIGDRKKYFIMGAHYVERRMQSWLNDEAVLKEKYPDYSLEKEMKNPVFFKMLSLDISQEQAYVATHFDSILNDEMNRAACLYSDNLRARGVRPYENGVLGSGGVAMKSGVSTLSRGQRADIAKRALNGEKISF